MLTYLNTNICQRFGSWDHVNLFRRFRKTCHRECFFPVEISLSFAWTQHLKRMNSSLGPCNNVKTQREKHSHVKVFRISPKAAPIIYLFSPLLLFFRPLFVGPFFAPRRGINFPLHLPIRLANVPWRFQIQTRAH